MAKPAAMRIHLGVVYAGQCDDSRYFHRRLCWLGHQGGGQAGGQAIAQQVRCSPARRCKFLPVSPIWPKRPGVLHLGGNAMGKLLMLPSAEFHEALRCDGNQTAFRRNAEKSRTGCQATA